MFIPKVPDDFGRGDTPPRLLRRVRAQEIFPMTEAALEVQPGEEGPVTVSIARKVRPGREAEYEQWVSDIVAAAATCPGYLGASVLWPSPRSMGST